MVLGIYLLGTTPGNECGQRQWILCLFVMKQWLLEICICVLLESRIPPLSPRTPLILVGPKVQHLTTTIGLFKASPQGRSCMLFFLLALSTLPGFGIPGSLFVYLLNSYSSFRKQVRCCHLLAHGLFLQWLLFHRPCSLSVGAPMEGQLFRTRVWCCA